MWAGWATPTIPTAFRRRETKRQNARNEQGAFNRILWAEAPRRLFPEDPVRERDDNAVAGPQVYCRADGI